MGNQGGKALKWLPAHFNFERSNHLDCLENHTQYICGTCGRYICIEHDPHRGLQRWNFPFKSLEIAKLYLRTADYSMKMSDPA